ncbi:cilia- and flagella-associated protein 100 [Megachile rotundata]|uniref:cilia- and flagella-associated protein 100 n=1 Tax=Megachile rotundata TaxID=143995 RepID=UPI003FD3D49F
MTDATRLCEPRLIRKKTRKSSYQKRFFKTQYYFTKGHEHLGEARNVFEEQSPFAYPPCSLMFSYFQYWKAKKRSTNLDQRSGVYQNKRIQELLRSLRVDVDIETLEAKKHKELHEAIAITDVDPRFFKELSGRVVKEKFSVTEYVNDIRNIFKARLLAGEELDDCIRIDQQFVEEQKSLNKIKRRYRRYVSGFEGFLSRDHEESMKILEEAENESKLTKEITLKRNQLSKEFGQVRLDVYYWEENWRMVKMCQRFLYKVSPNAWRMEHDWIYRRESVESIDTVDTADIFGRYRMVEQVPSIDALIDLFEEDIRYEGPAELYFEDPYQLVRVFRTIEMQNLNALIHLESLAEPLTEMVLTIDSAEEQIRLEVQELINAIDELKDSIEKLETRAIDLEQYANRLLRSVFREAVCSEEVLRLRVFIEDAYEACIGPNDANFDTFTMMKWIEKTHEELNLELDALPPEMVRTYEKEGFKQELRAMKETENAARKFELMHRLLDSLKRAMEPPIIKKRPLMWRSVPLGQRVKEIPAPLEPTEEEKQYLAFFTEYCKDEDFEAYRSLFPDDFDLSFEPRRRETIPEEEESERTTDLDN